MTLTLDKMTDEERRPLKVLFKEARQRRRRRLIGRLTIAIVVLVAALVVTLNSGVIEGSTSRANPSPPVPTAASVSRTGATLVAAYSSLRIINADSGATSTLPLPAPAGLSSDLAMIKIGRSLVLSRGDMAWLYGPGLHGPPLDLGPSLRVIPGPTDGQMWIWSEPCAEAVCTAPALAQTNGTVRLVDAAGHQIGAPIPLPVDTNWFPTGQSVGSGLVLAVAYGSGTSNQTEIWDPRSHAPPKALPSYPLAASGDWIATESTKDCPPRCSIQLNDVQSGKSQAVSLPRGVTVSGPGAISPDGGRIALLGTFHGRRGEWPSIVVVVDLETRTSQVLRNSGRLLQSAYGPPPVSWSSSGWLFATRIGGQDVATWRPGLRAMVILPRVRLPAVHLDPPQFQTEDPNLLVL
jgi:hypothetical protein